MASSVNRFNVNPKTCIKKTRRGGHRNRHTGTSTVRSDRGREDDTMTMNTVSSSVWVTSSMAR